MFFMNNHFKIVVPLYNVEKWIKLCIRSVKKQDYNNFECVLVDDISTDKTVEIIKKEIKNDNRFHLVVNKDKKLALRNIYEGIEYLKPKQNDIIITLDGDDWLAGPSVLSFLNNKYKQEDCWLTYGSYMEYPSKKRGKFASEIPDNIIENQLYRSSPWMSSHLRTFKYGLWNKINKEDLLDPKGNFFPMAWDLSFMFPMLEMAGKKSAFIEKVLYVYNRDNPINDDKVNNFLQISIEKYIREKEKYKELESL